MAATRVLADACLVRMSELHDLCHVFTGDRDLLVYRHKGRAVIPLLTPFCIPAARQCRPHPSTPTHPVSVMVRALAPLLSSGQPTKVTSARTASLRSRMRRVVFGPKSNSRPA